MKKEGGERENTKLPFIKHVQVDYGPAILLSMLPTSLCLTFTVNLKD